MLGADLLDDLIPKNVAVPRCVRLRRARQPLAPSLGQLERVLDDAGHALASEDGRLDTDLVRQPGMRTAADARVLAFGVLAHKKHVDRR